MEVMNECLRKLEAQAEPTNNDKRVLKYVNYINTFLKHFGEERVYLVGSTGDGTKLTLPADDGDADYLVVSSQLEVPADCLEFKTSCPSYSWVRGDRIPECDKFDLFGGIYLDANLLREISPQLFGIARGIYLHLSANFDRLNAADPMLTTLGIQSKVGLAHSTYRNIEIHGDIEKYRKNRFQEKGLTELNSNKFSKLPSLEIHPDDTRIIKRVYEMVQIARRPGDQDTFHGNFAFFATLLEEAIKETPSSDADFPISEDVEPNIAHDTQKPKTVSEDKEYTDITLAYKRMGNKDFVPSLRVKGKLECMEQWRKRVSDAGLNKETVDDIYNTDVFLISRESLINPNRSKDFSLAFGLHEQKLVRRFSQRQKMRYLMLKTLRKGLFELQLQGNKLRTYHMKTVAFWKFEDELKSSKEVDSSDTEILKSFLNALYLLKVAVQDKNLKHYFTGGNLFANFEDNDFRVINNTLELVLESPITSMVNAFELSQVESREIILTKDEVYLILDLNADGGKNDGIKRIREALVDIVHGVNKKRDDEGRSYLKKAILEVTRLVLEDEIFDQTAEEASKNNFRKQGQLVEFGDLFKSVRKITNTDEKRSQENIEMVVNFASLLSNIVPGINKEMNKIGGTETIRNVLQGAASMDSDTDAVNIDELIVLLEKYLSCSEEEKDRIGNELKVKFACIFL